MTSVQNSTPSSKVPTAFGKKMKSGMGLILKSHQRSAQTDLITQYNTGTKCRDILS
jgi:hypothetical protein